MPHTTPTYPLAEFQRGAREHIQRLQETGQPEVLTVDGNEEIVIQSADAYRELLDRVDRAEAIAGIQRGLSSIRRGVGVPAEEALDGLRARLGLSSPVR